MVGGDIKVWARYENQSNEYLILLILVQLVMNFFFENLAQSKAFVENRFNCDRLSVILCRKALHMMHYM